MTRITVAVPSRRPGPPLRSRNQARPRLSVDVVTRLAVRATPRDRWLLRMLAEHKVLTSVQIAQLGFGSPVTARHRLTELWRLRAIDRAQPFTAVGSAPMHYVLGDAGAALLAAEANDTAANRTAASPGGYRRDRALAVFASSHLAHSVGVNGVMAALVATARTRPGCTLTAWWAEQRCVRQWGTMARPDAYGRWHEAGQPDTDFFLEFDNGTETVDRVAAKLPGYAALASSTGISTPVLFWFPSAAREASIRAALSGKVADKFAGKGVPVATTSPEAGGSPADAVWLPVDRDGPRQPLAALAIPPPSSTGVPEPGTDQGQVPHGPVSPMPPSPESEGEHGARR